MSCIYILAIGKGRNTWTFSVRPKTFPKFFDPLAKIWRSTPRRSASLIFSKLQVEFQTANVRCLIFTTDVQPDNLGPLYHNSMVDCLPAHQFPTPTIRNEAVPGDKHVSSWNMYCLLTIQLKKSIRVLQLDCPPPLHTYTKNHTSQSHALNTFWIFETCTNLFLVSVWNQGFLKVNIKCPIAYISSVLS